MKKFSYVLTDESGIHARPAGQLVKKAEAFRSRITLQRGEKTADAKRIFSVMGLAAKKGDTVTVTASGPDEDAATSELSKFMRDNM